MASACFSTRFLVPDDPTGPWRQVDGEASLFLSLGIQSYLLRRYSDAPKLHNSVSVLTVPEARYDWIPNGFEHGVWRVGKTVGELRQIQMVPCSLQAVCFV